MISSLDMTPARSSPAFTSSIFSLRMALSFPLRSATSVCSIFLLNSSSSILVQISSIFSLSFLLKSLNLSSWTVISFPESILAHACSSSAILRRQLALSLCTFSVMRFMGMQLNFSTSPCFHFAQSTLLYMAFTYLRNLPADQSPSGRSVKKAVGREDAAGSVGASAMRFISYFIQSGTEYHSGRVVRRSVGLEVYGESSCHEDTYQDHTNHYTKFILAPAHRLLKLSGVLFECLGVIQRKESVTLHERCFVIHIFQGLLIANEFLHSEIEISLKFVDCLLRLLHLIHTGIPVFLANCRQIFADPLDLALALVIPGWFVLDDRVQFLQEAISQSFRVVLVDAGSHQKRFRGPDYIPVAQLPLQLVAFSHPRLEKLGLAGDELGLIIEALPAGGSGVGEEEGGVGVVGEYDCGETHLQNNRKLVGAYNVICKLEGVMDDNDNNPHPRRPTFLSEYQSHESESHSARDRHIRSGRIMRKLKQLWLKQRYLTDDEMESGREGHFDTERESGQGRWEKPAVRPPADPGEEKRFHPRQVSSEEEQLNIIRKKSNKHSAQSQEPSKESRDMEELEEIAAFNSEVENESK